MLALPTSSILSAFGSFLLFATIVAAATSTPAESSSSTVSCDRYHHTGFWDIDIDNYPDLPPACGPPISLHAIRDKSKLPYEVGAVVGAYFFFVFALLSLLLTWGRRMRQAALGSNGTLEIEMVNSPQKRFDGSPISPASTSKSWIKKGVTSLKSLGSGSTRTSRAGSNPASPGVASINSFDGNVLTGDRDRAHKDMERLYAAVMAHDEAKKSNSWVQEAEVAQATGMTERSQRPKMRLQLSDPRIATLAAQGNISEPNSPRSPVRAIYPPDHNWPATYPITPSSPIVARVPLENDLYPASPPPKSPPRMTFPLVDGQTHLPASPRSLLQRRERQGSSGNVSIASSASKARKSIRTLHISGPYPQKEDDVEEREPLTPRNYPNPGKPPQPPTPHTGNTVSTNESGDYRYESLDQPAPLPLPQTQPQRRPANLTVPTSNDLNPATAPSNVVGLEITKSPASSTSTLPLRAFQNASITSPGPTKTTFVDRGNLGVGRGPMTGRTPRTGVPMTPYSPYMPFSPITPVTPRLVGKRERKERVKQAGKKVIIEEDMVKDQDWDM